MRVGETLGVAVALVACLAACGLGRPADTEERVERFEAMLSEELGTAVELQCPPMVDRTQHYCTAVVPAYEDLVFPVRVISRGDELDYSTKLWITGARMEELGRHALQEKLDIAVDSLACPPISHMPEGATARCEASAEGITIPVEVVVVVKVRKLSFEPVGGVVFGHQAARVAHETLHEEVGHAEVTCPRKVVVSVPGRRFECTAVLPDETVRTIHYLITSAEGTFELGTEPPEAGTAEGPAAPEEASAGHEHEGEHRGEASQ